MISRKNLLIWISLLCYVISFFLESIYTSGLLESTLKGYKAFFLALFINADDATFLSYLIRFLGISNFILLLSFLSLYKPKFKVFRTILVFLLPLSFAAQLLFLILTMNDPELGVTVLSGFYLWMLSYLVTLILIILEYIYPLVEDIEA